MSGWDTVAGPTYPSRVKPGTPQAMTNDVLLRNIQSIEENEDEIRSQIEASFYSIPAPSAPCASDQWDNMEAWLQNVDLDELFPEYRKMLKEAARRGLMKYTPPEDR